MRLEATCFAGNSTFSPYPPPPAAHPSSPGRGSRGPWGALPAGPRAFGPAGLAAPSEQLCRDHKAHRVVRGAGGEDKKLVFAVHSDRFKAVASRLPQGVQQL